MAKKKPVKVSCLSCGTDYDQKRYGTCPTCARVRMNELMSSIRKDRK